MTSRQMPSTPMTGDSAHRSGLVRRACPNCGSKLRQPVLSVSVRDFVDVNPSYNFEEFGSDLGFRQDDVFDIVRCRECEFDYSLDRLTDDLNFLLYSKIIDPAYSRTKTQSSAKREYTLRVWAKLLSLHDERGGGPAVLDYGCGWGQFLVHAKGAGVQAVGIEMEPSRVDLLRHDGFRIERSLSELSANERFNMVICNHVLEHVDDPARTLRSISEIVRPGGVGFFAVPCFGKRRIDKLAERSMNGGSLPKAVNPWEHLNYFSPRSFEAMLRRYRFEVICSLTTVPPPRVASTWPDRLSSWYGVSRAFAARLKRIMVPSSSADTSVFVRRVASN